MRAQLPANVAQVYDPTCGDGGLLRIFGDEVRKYGVEIDGAEAEKARSIPNSTIFAGDTLATDYFPNIYFDTIMMCEIDPLLNPIEDFLDSLQAVINKHRASQSSPDNQTDTEDCK